MTTSPTRGPWPPRTVADLMCPAPACVGPDETIRTAARLLLDHGVSGLPVVDDRGKVLGVFSATDLLWHADELTATARRSPPGVRSAFEPLGDRTVRELMTPDIFAVRPDDTLDDLLRFLVKRGLHRALVMEGEELVGLVSFSDLLPLVAGRPAAADPEPGAGHVGIAAAARGP